MADELDVQTNFRSQTWEEGREALDSVFHRIFDILRSNPTLHALVDGREGEPTHKAGDFVTDYRTGDVKLKMSDGKNLLEISISALGGTINDEQHGELSFETPAGDLHHPIATTSDPGFLSAADKTKLDGLSNATPSNATPASNPLGGAGAAGSSGNYSRADHVHPVTSNTTPSGLGTAAVGSSTQPARADHVHAHGNLGGGALHAVATTSTAGFMSSTDKATLAQFDGYQAGGAAPAPALGHYTFWYDSAGALGTYLYFTGGGGTKRVLLS